MTQPLRFTEGPAFGEYAQSDFNQFFHLDLDELGSPPSPSIDRKAD
jgi:hypothetical protein